MGLFSRAKPQPQPHPAPQAAAPHAPAAGQQAPAAAPAAPQAAAPQAAAAPAAAKPGAGVATGAAAGAGAGVAGQAAGGGAAGLAASVMGGLGSATGSVLGKGEEFLKQGLFGVLMMAAAYFGMSELMKRISGDDKKPETGKGDAAKPEAAKTAAKADPAKANPDSFLDVEARRSMQREGARLGFAGGPAEAGSALRNGEWRQLEGSSRGALLVSGKDSVGAFESRSMDNPGKFVVASQTSKVEGVSVHRGAVMRAEGFEIGDGGRLKAGPGLDGEMATIGSAAQRSGGRAEAIAIKAAARGATMDARGTGIVAEPTVGVATNLDRDGKGRAQLVSMSVNGEERSATIEPGRIVLMRSGQERPRVIDDPSIRAERGGFGFSDRVARDLEGFMEPAKGQERGRVASDVQRAVAATPMPAMGSSRQHQHAGVER